MCFKNFIVLSILIISINSKSYVDPKNSDDIISEAEAESWRSNSISQIYPGRKLDIFYLQTDSIESACRYKA